MATLVEGPGGVRFVGSVDADADVEAAALIAAACAAYRPDDDDEDPLGGAVNCFGCRFRRWSADGFTCMKALLPPQVPVAR
jgi:hypothetical protein